MTWDETALTIARAVVGECIYDPRRLEEAVSLCVDDVGPRMGAVWAAIRNIEADGGAVTSMSVAQRIKLDDISGLPGNNVTADQMVSEAICGVAESPFPTHTVDGFAQGVRALKKASRHHRLALDTAALAGDIARGLEVERAEARILEMLTAQPSEDLVSLRDIVATRAAAVSVLHDKKAAGEVVYTGIPTGFRAFDAVYGGLPRGLVSILGADTGVGKSAFARAFAYGAVKSGAGAALIFSLEDGNENLADRVIGEQTGLGATKVRQLDFTDPERIRILGSARQPYLDMIFVEDSCYEVDDICHRARSFARKRPVALIVIDYIQLVSLPGAQSDTIAIKRALLSLQMLAKQTGAAVLVLSQVATKALAARGAEYYYKELQAGGSGEALYEGYCPQRGDFAWASELDQYGKLVMVGFRSGPYKRAHSGDRDDDKTISLRVLKANFGPSGKRFSFKWHAALAQVAEA